MKSHLKTTLATRIAKQRERQVAFLKSKGMIDDEAALRGGAGAASPANSKSPTPRKGMRNLSTSTSPPIMRNISSFSSKRWSSPSSGVSVAQDEV